MKQIFLFFALSICLLITAAPHNVMAQSVETEPTDTSAIESDADASEQNASAPPSAPPLYEKQLSRVTEILGALHYLENLCSEQPTDQYRTKMQELLDAETINEPRRYSNFIAQYNKGYRAFASIHTKCTKSALLAQNNYKQEGYKIINDVVSRFGN